MRRSPQRLAIDLNNAAAIATSMLTMIACPSCATGQRAWELVLADAGGVHEALVLAPLLILSALAAGIERSAAHPARSLIGAGLLLGAGLGGFVDGILLHQILQWHNLLSSVRPPTDLVAMKYNMVWDGLFHAFTWLMVLAGVWRLWIASDAPRGEGSGRILVAGMLLGWGLFNFIEGSIDHQWLGIHHVHPGVDQLAWDMGFLALGLLLIGLGYAWLRTLGVTRQPQRNR